MPTNTHKGCLKARVLVDSGRFSARLSVNCKCWTQPQRWIFCAARRATGWKHCPATVRASTAYASTSNGAYVFTGTTAMPSTWKSLIIIEVIEMTTNKIRPIHPGEILREEYLEPLGLSANALALALRVPATRVGDILHERRGISPDTALRLARYFDTDPQSWMNLQTSYDLKIAVNKHGKVIEQEVSRAANA